MIHRQSYPCSFCTVWGFKLPSVPKTELKAVPGVLAKAEISLFYLMNVFLLVPCCHRKPDIS